MSPLSAMKIISISACTLLLLVACSSSPPKKTNDICAIFDQRGSWYGDAKDANERWGTPIHVMMAIIKQESGFVDDAKPPKKKFLWVIPAGRVSSAYGYAQALDSTWDNYKDETGNWFADRDDFDDAIDFVGWYTNKTYQRNGISKWDAYNQYLAYHEGHGGYARGTYNSKAWLKRVARRVDNTSKTYAAQLKTCS